MPKQFLWGVELGAHSVRTDQPAPLILSEEMIHDHLPMEVEAVHTPTGIVASAADVEREAKMFWTMFGAAGMAVGGLASAIKRRMG